jgi:PAS domain S-box-containing protein
VGTEPSSVLPPEASDALRRAEEALGLSEALNRRIIESCRDCIQILDPDGLLLSTSREGRRLLEAPDAEAMEGLSWLDLWRGSDRRKAEAALAAALATGAGKFQGICPTFRGKPRWWDVLVTPILDAAGEPHRLLAVSRDITEQKSVEDALRRSEEQLRQSQKMEAVGRLAGGVAHDFNNLITAIAGYSDLLLRSMPGEDPQRGHVLEIRKAGERAAALTRQLLTFSRKRTAVAKVFDLDHAVADMRQMLVRLIGEDIELATRSAGPGTRVSADPSQVEQVILNLAVNARDAMPRGGRLTIETSGEPMRPGLYFPVDPGPYVRLTVSDTGVGMDAEVRNHLFEPFFTTKPAGHGTGLGLSMVYGIVQQAGGNLAVESEPGRGTSISIWLPAARGAAEEASHHGPEPTPRRRRSGETILLVEDEDMVRRLVAQVLESQGYRVLEASSGAQALAAAHALEGPLDLLLTDVVMAGMSGRELSEKLAGLRPGLKVLYMSGYTEDAVLRHGVYQNSTAFLGKPFSPLALVQKIREMLETGTGDGAEADLAVSTAGSASRAG